MIDEKKLNIDIINKNTQEKKDILTYPGYQTLGEPTKKNNKKKNNNSNKNNNNNNNENRCLASNLSHIKYSNVHAEIIKLIS